MNSVCVWVFNDISEGVIPFKVLTVKLPKYSTLSLEISREVPPSTSILNTGSSSQLLKVRHPDWPIFNLVVMSLVDIVKSLSNNVCVCEVNEYCVCVCPFNDMFEGVIPFKLVTFKSPSNVALSL